MDVETPLPGPLGHTPRSGGAPLGAPRLPTALSRTHQQSTGLCLQPSIQALCQEELSHSPKRREDRLPTCTPGPARGRLCSFLQRTLGRRVWRTRCSPGTEEWPRQSGGARDPAFGAGGVCYRGAGAPAGAPDSYLFCVFPLCCCSILPFSAVSGPMQSFPSAIKFWCSRRNVLECSFTSTSSSHFTDAGLWHCSALPPAHLLPLALPALDPGGCGAQSGDTEATGLHPLPRAPVSRLFSLLPTQPRALVLLPGVLPGSSPFWLSQASGGGTGAPACAPPPVPTLVFRTFRRKVRSSHGAASLRCVVSVFVATPGGAPGPRPDSLHLLEAVCSLLLPTRPCITCPVAPADLCVPAAVAMPLSSLGQARRAAPPESSCTTGPGPEPAPHPPGDSPQLRCRRLHPSGPRAGPTTRTGPEPGAQSAAWHRQAGSG